MDLIGIYFAQNDQKSEILTQMIWYIDISVNFIIWNRDFSSKGHIPDTPRATSKSSPPPEIFFSTSELWIIFRSSPRVLDILGFCQFAGVSTRAVDRILKSRIKSDLKSQIKSDLSDSLTGRKPLLLWSF